MGEDLKIRAQERENLRYIIQQWNDNRLDLFEISEPDEKLEFHGVMRYYFQDSGQKVSTKCIRVSSLSTTQDVIDTLVEKFRPDMRMLSIPVYTLYEIHENEERRLDVSEKPLLVQLNWNKDDREGRFLLRRMELNGMGKLKTLPPVPASTAPSDIPEPFVRKLSRREKKERKKQDKMRRHALSEELHAAAQGDQSVAEKLYTELPETSFTRSISNPEAVMRRRRAQKLEKKLQQFRSKNGGPDTGGTLKIYGESLCKDVPYKTLLLSVRDSAAHVVKEMLEKYGLYREDPNNYCLVQCIVTAEETLDGYEGKIVPQKEYILDDDECPLAILMNHPPSRGSIMFQVRRRPADHGQRRRKKKPLIKGAPAPGTHQGTLQRHPHQAADAFPFLIELGPDGNEMGVKGRQVQLQLNVTEVGSDRIAHAGVAGGQSLHLIGPYIQPRHSVMAHTDGIVTVTPCSRDAETYVNFQRVFETTILQHGAVVRFGRTNTFRFIDPQQDDRHRVQAFPQPAPPQQSPYFDRNNYERYGAPRDPILPAVLEFREDAEDTFFHNIITQLDPTDIQFKLGPTYTLYMAARFRASTHYRSDLVPTERAQKLTIMLIKVSDIIHKVIEYKHRDPTALAFWMANASELLHFLKQDRHICGYSLEAQDILAEAVQFAFRRLVDCMQIELSSAMPLFLEDRNDRGEEEGCTAHVLSILTNTMALLRRCRVNAALTIQLFSQLFHFVNMWVFNKVVLEHSPNYCTREWGERLKERLARIELWAEKQGLELAADCHLAKLSQAALLLTAPKSSPDDVAIVSSTCFKLNSLQLREILEKYEPLPGEPPVPKDLIDNVVGVAETTADGLAREDGREIRLGEDADLQLPFLLPEDGYSCDILRGVPSGLAEFLEPLQRAQLCRMTPQPTSSGYWTIYMHNHQEIMNQRPPPGPRSPSAMSNRSTSVPRGEPEVHVIELHKANSGMGLSIVATKGENQDQLGIYIKSVVRGGAADQDGRLQAGDQLLAVDGKSLVGISQEQAAEYMVATGPIVTLQVARQGALFHGLAPILSQPSPQVNRVVGRRASNDTNYQSPTGQPDIYSDRLVDWTRQPKGYQAPGQRPPLPLPDPSPPTNRPTKFPSEFPYPATPNHPHDSLMMSSRSSPNLAAHNRLSGSHTNPYFNQPTHDKLYPLHSSLTNLNAKGNAKLSLVPSSCDILSERVHVGISHRRQEDTMSNPHLPKYTYTPLEEPSHLSRRKCTTSSGHQYCWSKWKQKQTELHHGSGCCLDKRKPLIGQFSSDWRVNSTTPTNPAASAQRQWRSLVEIKDNSPSVSSYSGSSLSNKSPLASRLSEPLTFDLDDSVSDHSHAMTRSTPDVRYLLQHSPPNTPPPSSTKSFFGPPLEPRGPQSPPNQQRPSQSQHDGQQYRPQPYPSKPNSAYPQPRIQPSKSVPSLNTEPGNSMMARGGPHSAFSQAYPRNNSASSLPQQPARSKSTQNLNEGTSLSISARHPSNPVLSTEDDRHYQNVSFHQGGQDPRMGSQKGARPMLYPNHPMPGMPGQDGSQRPTSVHLQRDDPRNVSLHRPASQQNIREDPRMSQMNEIVHRREGAFHSNAYPGPTGPTSPGMVQSSHSGSVPAFQRPQQPIRPQSPYTPTYPGQHGQGPVFTYPPNAPAPMNMRGVVPPQQMSPQVAPPQQLSPAQYANSLQGGIGSKLPPPTAPKPNRNSGSHMEAPEKPVRQPEPRPLAARPPLQDDHYSESPPPPPPPVSTHPLLQTGPISNSSAVDTAKLLTVKGPWLKDEKQRYEQKKREHLRRRRDEHIASLEQLELRSPQEEEKLKTLRLEREFQRRAEQEEEENEDNEDEQSEEVLKTPTKGWFPETKTNGMEDRRADEIRRKQQELEVARAAEDRLLKEAQRRQDEEQRHRQQQTQRHQHHASQRLDSLVGSQGPQSNGEVPSSPQPPERNSSYSVMQQQSPVSSMAGRNRPNDAITPVKKVQFSATDSVETHFYDDNANEKATIPQDPNDFFNDADLMLNANCAPQNINLSSTPGVIGAQEVYRDPRQRLLAEAAQKAAAVRPTGPEKLTFREKMKMFAKETGDPDTPKDKAKTSKAQREIES